ncbi:TIGR03086 family protein [Nocardioides sp. JQ2195]|uniref:TIGR03086 family metal-binding protein n=1 Tax=Nocardioides sp. JQ2195 TaxID=2592334 RepID=UPI00143E94F3|nr:TIGR03086 family metal-binding protein [Nocardioides sp. JQ2195]QIX27992.1 TIGR03086 family protein [Nocardioides sp. JQ2195]
MTTATGSIPLLSRAIDQAGDVLAAVRQEQFSQPTPCADWDVGTLVGHLTATPGNFLAAARGVDVDWSNAPVPDAPGWAEEFRERGDDLLHHWHEVGEDGANLPIPMQVAELAVHAWDLARAAGYPRPLDEGVAQCGLDFMEGSLTDELRGEAFGERVEISASASYVDRLAAFAGRQP